jgi:hypothetical protein
MARLVSITKVSAVTQDIMSFVNFQAQQKGIEIGDDTKVAILQIENIPSYHIVFLDSDMTMEELEEELKRSETQLSHDTKSALMKHMR